jgi:hypothetical protein
MKEHKLSIIKMLIMINQLYIVGYLETYVMPEGIICSSCFKSVPITNKVGEEEVCRSCKAGSFSMTFHAAF